MYPIKLMMVTEDKKILPFIFDDDLVQIAYQGINDIKLSNIVLFDPHLICFNTSRKNIISVTLTDVFKNPLLSGLPPTFQDLFKRLSISQNSI